MTHPEIKVSWVSHVLRANGTRMYAEHADFISLFRVSPRSSASQLKFGGNYVYNSSIDLCNSFT